MKTIIFSFIALLISPLPVSGQKAAQKTVKKAPNIILIFADDLGYGDIGCYDQEKTETPKLNKLAAKGLKFNQFYSGTSVCAPSRASLMTGLHTGHTPIRGNKGTETEGQSPLPDSSVTFANFLQSNG